MPCFYPRKLYYNDSKDTGYSWTPPKYSDIYIKNPKHIIVSCKQCKGCRLEYSRQWAMRITHEQSLWLNNIFITLTYDDDHLPQLGNSTTLVKKDFQDFMKRLRKKENRHPNDPIRYYHCGEYGEQFGRPHYHAILFNQNFSDRETLQGHKGLTISEQLSKLWGKGHTSIGDVTFQSASYVAGYVQKKINGKQKEEHYQVIDPGTGQYYGQRQQEYSTMSRRPGIAGHWFAKHKNDVYPSDNVHINGREMRPPKYYDRLYEIDHRDQMDIIKENRVKEMEKTAHLRTPEALQYAEKTMTARMGIYKRGKLL